MMKIRPGICRVLVDQLASLRAEGEVVEHLYAQMHSARVVANGPAREDIRMPHVGETVMFPRWAVSAEFELDGHAFAIIYASAIDGTVEM